MSWLGRFRLGQSVPLELPVKDSSNTPVEPDAAPTATVYSSSARIEDLELPVLDPFRVTGLFREDLFLGALYATGFYVVQYNYAVGGVFGGAEDAFEIVGGGDAVGHVLSLFHFPHAASDFLIVHREDGTVVRRRNPRVE